MLRTRITVVTAAVGVAGLVAALSAAPAAAHERRAAGRYRFVVGFGTEPAYAGEKNSVQVKISDAGGKPVTDLGDGLKVEVTQGAAQASRDASAAGGDAGQQSLGVAIISQLASRMDRELPRLSVALATSQQRVARAANAAGQARLIAIIGVAAGVLGLVTLSVSATRRRRP